MRRAIALAVAVCRLSRSI